MSSGPSDPAASVRREVVRMTAVPCKTWSGNWVMNASYLLKLQKVATAVVPRTHDLPWLVSVWSQWELHRM